MDENLNIDRLKNSTMVQEFSICIARWKQKELKQEENTIIKKKSIFIADGDKKDKIRQKW